MVELLSRERGVLTDACDLAGVVLAQPHSVGAAAVAAALAVEPEQGLSTDEARRRLVRVGPNALVAAPAPGVLRLVLGQFWNPLVVILLVAAIVSGVTGDLLDAGVILAVLVANALLGASQEFRAEAALAALREMSAPTARVLRDGALRDIPAAEVVPGDVALVRAGDLVPADGRLWEAASLAVDESALTGESAPVEKDAGALLPVETALGDRTNVLLLGTAVTLGRGSLLVTGTGSATEMGRLARSATEGAPRATPLQRQVAWLARVLSAAALAASAAVLLLGLLRHEPLGAMLLVALSLAVAAVPEALPAVQTIVLAVGVQRMARRKAIVRRLPAVEALGAATVICTDKTGTLTLGDMRVSDLLIGGRRLRLRDGELCEVGPAGERSADAAGAIGVDGLDELLRAAVLCSDARAEPAPSGDPVERALLRLARTLGADPATVRHAWPRVAEFPFTSERKRMTTVHRRVEADAGASERQLVAYAKGAPDVLLPRCSHVWAGGTVRPLTAERREALEVAIEAMAAASLRLVALAYRPLPAAAAGEHDDERERLAADEVERDLTFLGIAGLLDPPRPEVPGALAAARAAGIRTVMITGDHPTTAAAIAAQLGLDGGRLVTGSQLAQMDVAALAEAAGEASVYARVAPQQKADIVRALQRRDEVVAMTGDGANDAPALRLADIGVAMGVRGTAVAKEAAGVVLADDHYATIVAAVEEGRTIYANLRKVVLYLLSGNLGEVLVVLVAMVLGLPLPLQPIHILWINLVTDALPALGLGMEPAEPGMMARPPRRPGESFLPRWTVPLIAVPSVLLAVVTLVAFVVVLSQPAHDLVAAQSAAFATLVVAHLGIGWLQRATLAPSLTLAPLSNPLLLVAVLAGAGLMLPLLMTPVGHALFHTSSPAPAMWALVVALSPLPLLGGEVAKAVVRKAARKHAGERGRR